MSHPDNLALTSGKSSESLIKGVVMEVLGPKCNGRSSTLNGPPSRGDDIDGIGCQLGSKVPDIVTSGLPYLFVEAPEVNA